MSWPRTAEASCKVMSSSCRAERSGTPADLARRASFANRPPPSPAPRRRRDESRGRGPEKPFSTRPGASAHGFDQLDRPAAAASQRRNCERTPPAHRARARSPAAQPSTRKNGPAPSPSTSAIHGRLDVLDDVGVVVRLAELRSKQVLRHNSPLQFSLLAGSRPPQVGASPASTQRQLVLPPASSSALYSSCLRVHEPMRSCGTPSGASCHSSWRPNGVMSSSAQMLLSSSAARAVV